MLCIEKKEKVEWASRAGGGWRLGNEWPNFILGRDSRRDFALLSWKPFETPIVLQELNFETKINLCECFKRVEICGTDNEMWRSRPNKSCLKPKYREAAGPELAPDSENKKPDSPIMRERTPFLPIASLSSAPWQMWRERSRPTVLPQSSYRVVQEVLIEQLTLSIRWVRF